MSWDPPLPPETGDEAADLAAFLAWELERERRFYPDRFGPDGVRLPQPREFTFYVGAPEPSWLNRNDGVPKFISAARFDRYKSEGERWPVSTWESYAIDSGAYIALSNDNYDVPWWQDRETYASKVFTYATNSGGDRLLPDFCAPQDMPCEPPVRKKTGMTVDEHQDITTDSYEWLVREWPWLPWIPVLQGWEPDDYRRHRKKYEDRGIDLAACHRVGVGSVCRRAHLPEIVAVIEELGDAGLQLHGFGLKKTALPIVGHLLRSADSMAWSKHAKLNHIRLDGCTHTDCRNCYRYAKLWREEVLASMSTDPEPVTAPSGGRADTGIAKEIIVSTTTIKPGTKVRFRDLPVGAHFECPGRACKRQAKVKRDGRIGNHYCYGRQTCELAGEDLGDREVRYLREPAAPAGRGAAEPDDGMVDAASLLKAGPGTRFRIGEGRVFAFVSLKNIVWKVPNIAQIQTSEGEELEVPYRDRSIEILPAAETAAAADEAAALFASIVSAIPAPAAPEPEREPWKGIGPEPVDGVDIARVARGTFGKVYGKAPDGEARCVAGYVVEVREIGANCGGWAMPDPGYLVVVGDHPHALGGTPVWTEMDAQMTVCRAPDGKPGGAMVHVRPTAQEAVVSANQWYGLGLMDNLGEKPRRITIRKCGRVFRDYEELAGYLFGDYRDHRLVRQDVIDRHAVKKGDPDWKVCRRRPLCQVREGALGTLVGRPDRGPDTEPAAEARPVFGTFMRYWSPRHGDQGRDTINVTMRVDDPKTCDGKRVINVAVPASGEVWFEHAKPGQDAEPAADAGAPEVGAVLPIHEVPWGTYGRVSGYGPDGSVASKYEGYLVQMPRLFTGNIMDKPKLCGPGNPLFSFEFLAIREITPGEKSPCYMGFYARLDATFTVLEPPAEYPLPGGDDSGYGLLLDSKRTSRSDRMPAQDVRAGDLVADGEMGMPMRSGRTTLVLGDPKPRADGKVELLIEQDGEVRTYVIHGTNYVTVKEPVPYSPEHLEFRAWPEKPEGRTPLMPVMRRTRKNDIGFSVTCTVETCTGIRDGWTTARGAEVGWRRHIAEAHEADGYVAVWDYERWPMEPPINYRLPQRGEGTPNPASVEVIEPKDDPSWDEVRHLVDWARRLTDLGKRGVRVSFEQPEHAKDFAKAVIAGGVPAGDVTVNLPDVPGKPLSAAAVAALTAMGGEEKPAVREKPAQLSLLDDFMAAYEAENARV